MKTLFTFAFILFALNLHAQESDTIFGAYYQIDSYPIKAPFPEAPYQSPTLPGWPVKLTQYSYAFPSPEDDINLMYGVEICEITNKSSCSSEEECLKYYASLLKISVGSDKILKEEISDLGGKKILNLTLSLTIESVGAVVLTSVIREYKGVLVRTFVFSWPEDSDNSKIDAFFRSIEYL